MKGYLELVLVAAVVLMTGCSRDGAGNGKDLVVTPGEFGEDAPAKLEQDIQKSQRCSMDAVNGALMSKDLTWEIKRGQEIVMAGWAVSEDSKEAPAQVFVRLKGDAKTYYGVTTNRFARPDANMSNAADQALNLGFELKAKTDRVEPGAYQITILQSVSTGTEGCKSAALLLVD